MDLEVVKVLAAQYKEAGLGDTRSGRFLSDLATSGVAPRGGGVTWLQALVENGDPRPSVLLAAEMSALLPSAGGDARYLTNIISRLSAGNKARDWELEVIGRVRGRGVTPAVPLTDEQVSVLNSVTLQVRNAHGMYWARRPGVKDKAERITRDAMTTGTIHPDDWSWIQDKFKGTIRAVNTTAGDDGQIRFYRDYNKGWLTVLVMGTGRYDPNWRAMVQDCLIDGQLMAIPIKSLRKRPPKETK